MKPGALPFQGAKCEQRFKAWAKYLTNGDDYYVVNQSDSVLLWEYLRLAVAYDIPVVALDVNASKALKIVKHYKLPHPSGLNRKINDLNYLQSELSQCKLFVETKGKKPCI
jgi:hypothetical protein